MRQFDPIVKHIMDRFSTEFVRLIFNEANLEVVQRLDTAQTTIKVHQNDMTFKVRRSNGEIVLLHIEVQTSDSTDIPMPLRVLGYASSLVLRYRIPVYSLVLYLAPDAGITDPGTYSYGDDTLGLHLNYKVIRLADLEGSAFLETPAVGLLPFTPLMRPPTGMTPETWVEACVAKTHALPVDRQTRGTLLFALSLLGSLAHDTQLFEKLISEEIMQESPYYELILQRGIEQGIERGAREIAVKNISTILTTRFPDTDIHTVTQTLTAISDVERLTQLFNTALVTPSFNAFLQVLER